MGGGHGGDGHGTTYKGFTMHRPKRWHTVTGKGLCAIMWVSMPAGTVPSSLLSGLDFQIPLALFLLPLWWQCGSSGEVTGCLVGWFWVFYRAKQDGPVVLGWRHPWEGHDSNGHGHDH